MKTKATILSLLFFAFLTSAFAIPQQKLLKGYTSVCINNDTPSACALMFRIDDTESSILTIPAGQRLYIITRKSDKPMRVSGLGFDGEITSSCFINATSAIDRKSGWTLNSGESPKDIVIHLGDQYVNLPQASKITLEEIGIIPEKSNT